MGKSIDESRTPHDRRYTFENCGKVTVSPKAEVFVYTLRPYLDIDGLSRVIVHRPYPVHVDTM